MSRPRHLSGQRTVGPGVGGQSPSIAVPRGGGAIRGLGEKLSVNPSNGTATLTVPIAVTPGRGGFGPQLSLSYDSARGNGPFGIGWHVSLPAIVRRTDKQLPRYDDADTFILSGAEDLVPSLVDTGSGWESETHPRELDGAAYVVQRFRPRIEGLFARIEKWVLASSGETHWRTISSNNVTSVYGRTVDARIVDPADASRVFAWLIEETRDDRGNVILYTYERENYDNLPPSLAHEGRRVAGGSPCSQRHIKSIRYGNRSPFVAGDWAFEVVFDYGDHDPVTPTPTPAGTWPARPDAFSTCRAGFDLRTYRLCRRVLVFHRFAELGTTPCLVHSTDLQYATPIARTGAELESVTESGYIREDAGTYLKESLPPLAFTYTTSVPDETIRALDPASLENLPAGWDEERYRWVDLDGEGIAGVLADQGGAWMYKRNLGDAKLGPAETVATMPATADLGGRRQQLMDVAGDRRQYLVEFSDGLAGYYRREPDGTWGPFSAFEQQARIDWTDPNLRFIDLAGNGRADVLLADDDVFTMLESEGTVGYGSPQRIPKAVDEEHGPALVFSDSRESIFVADMNGDGLADLVLIRNGEVSYWPSLGYARFGAKVTMSAPPWFDHREQFEPGRLRLADVDGSGTTDLIYLGAETLTYWINESGNGWSDARELAQFPRTDELASVFVVDLLGNGTSCIVWSSPLAADAGQPVRYIDLAGGTKPYLLASIVNNLGSETRIRYVSSTKLFLEDEAAGRAWITRPPFPVQVVERVETHDFVSKTRNVRSYRYRHGYFDPDEQEFRGFAYVEQHDADFVASAAGAGLFTEMPPAADGEFRLPPVVTKSWFHTGVYFGAGELQERLHAEYYAGDADALGPPPSRLPVDLTGEELREAHRALRGMPLRSEVYALDGAAGEGHPFLVSDRAYRVDLVQPRHGNAFAVFRSCQSEAIDYHYDRNPADPRIGHQLNLEVDEFGHVTKSVALAYPRRTPAFSEQSTALLTYTETSFASLTDGDASYRIGVPIAQRTFEVTGIAPPGGGRYDLDALRDAIVAAPEIAYEATPPAAGTARRLVDALRSLYYADDLSGALPFGTISARALPFESYRMAFTTGHAVAVYGALVDDGMLGADGRYIQQDGAWWVPSGRQVFDAARFFLPTQLRNPYGGISSTHYDAHALLVVRLEDALGNVVRALNDYRAMAPSVVVDPNGNRTAVRTDARGLVTATAVMGKEGSADGDTLDDPTSTIEYRIFEWMDHRRPNHVRALARERHGDPLTRRLETRSYFDGSGREVMKKVQAEPGLAPGRDAAGALLRDAAGNLVLVDTSPAPRWIGSGRTILNNKDKPVKQYEPFFSVTAAYEDEDDLVQWGVTPILHYDALGRLRETQHPDGTITRVEFTPWQQIVHDANDTVLESEWHAARMALVPGTPFNDAERRADQLTVPHGATATRTDMDVLGRTFRAVQDNGAAGTFVTHTLLDVEGHPLRVTDARGNPAFTNRFDMLGRKLYFSSGDAGERWTLEDVGGRPIRKWDRATPAEAQQVRLTYDAGQRSTHLFVRRPGESETLAALTVYGESHPDPSTDNLRTRVLAQFDEAGVVRQERYDFSGRLLRSTRRYRADFTAADWTALDGLASLAAIDAAAEPQLDGEPFTSEYAYDALNRGTTLRLPDQTEIQPRFNAAGLLDRVNVRLRGGPTSTDVVASITYNARGQRERLEYDNGVASSYTYDDLTFRLRRLESTRAADGAALQDLHYHYDPVGNVIEVRDAAQQTVFFANAVVAPALRYEYDALYRLTRAAGREHAAAAGTQPDHADIPAPSLPHANDAQALRTYTEDYAYDPVGNLTSVAHTTASGNWTRRYEYAADSNRLLSTSVPGDPAGGPYSDHYAHDRRGNIIEMPHLSALRWNFNDQLRGADLNTGATFHVAYDASGQRARKTIVRADGRREETLYVGGVEIFRRWSGATLEAERQTLHVSDASRRVALLETVTVEDGAPVVAAPLARYQLENHLGSSAVEIDQAADVISYEEYYSLGGTAYRSARSGLMKRYRFSGKERDDGTGLYYFGARYYAAWLGRWISCDPLGMTDGPNLFAYVRNNPIRYTDPTGTRCCEDDASDSGGEREAALAALTGGKKQEGGKSLFSFLGDALGFLWEGIKAAAGAIWSGIVAAGRAIWSGIKAAATWLAGALKTAVTAIWNALKAAATWIWNALKTAARAVWTAITTAAGAVWRALRTAAAATAHALKVAAEATWSALKTAAKFLWDVTKTVVSFTWRWILAPSIRMATNALAGAALGFLLGGVTGAIIGGSIGAVTGGIHGWAMAYADTYDFGSFTGWVQFLVDNTWSLPNSVVASLFATANIFWNPIQTDKAGTGQLYFLNGWAGDYDTTLGNVTVGNIVPIHEREHGLQGRIFGPLYLPASLGHLIFNALVPYWLLYHDFKKKPITTFGEYFTRGVYPHTWHEEWAYSVEGDPP